METEQTSKIPTEEIQQDIAETWTEIHNMEREEKGLRMQSDRMSHFRADARQSGVEERRSFISKLEKILEERGAKKIGD